jgi:hypothetical protein
MEGKKLIFTVEDEGIRFKMGFCESGDENFMPQNKGIFLSF